METSFTLLSLKGILDEIPFDKPADASVDLDFSDIPVPYYIKYGFRVSIEYEESLPYDASCVIYSPKNIVTVVIIMKREYEERFKSWLKNRDNKEIASCCLRRELYCHEVCHLVAIIRAFPSNRSSKVREDFLHKISQKFKSSLKTAEGQGYVPLVSQEKPGSSPFIFDKDHFCYDDDSLDYTELYQELMLDHDRVLDCAEKLCADPDGKPVEFTDVARETFASQQFLHAFQKKLRELISAFAETYMRKKAEATF